MRARRAEPTLKPVLSPADNRVMRTLLVTSLALLALGPGPSRPLPHGNDHFHLGMNRAQVDSAVAARGLAIISNGTAFLVCASDEPAGEYEQYSFFMAPHGLDLLWKLTIGYRLTASTADYAAVREDLRRILGEPDTDSWDAGDAASPADSRPSATTQQAVWADAFTAVQLGARWTGAPDPKADRMVVTWVDRRLQRLVEARRKKDKSTASRQ